MPMTSSLSPMKNIGTAADRTTIQGLNVCRGISEMVSHASAVNIVAAKMITPPTFGVDLL